MAELRTDENKENEFHVGMDVEQEGDSADEGGNQQSKTERKQVRHTYREVIKTVTENQEEMSRSDNNSLLTQLRAVGTQFHRVKTPREASQDSYALRMICQATLQRAKDLITDFKVFDPYDFGKKVRAAVIEGFTGEEDPPDPFLRVCKPRGRQRMPPEPVKEAYPGLKAWATFGRLYRGKCMKIAPCHTQVFGIMNNSGTPKKAKAPRARRVLNKQVGAAVDLEKMDTFKGRPESEECATAEVEHIYKIIKTGCKASGNHCIGYFDLVMNPESFSQSVENVFFVAFLVRDGRVKLFIDEQGAPCITPVRSAVAKSAANKPNQLILEMDMAQWKDILDTYGIRETMIPTRPSKMEPLPKLKNLQDMPFRPLEFLQPKPVEFNLEEALAKSRSVGRGRRICSTDGIAKR